MVFERHDHVVESDGLAGDAHHARDRESPDIDVDDADAVALGRERAREVRRDARLADAALAGGDGDHRRLPVGEELLLLDRRGGPPRPPPPPLPPPRRPPGPTNAPPRP